MFRWSKDQWAQRDSNPHGRRGDLRILSPLRLPVPPQAQVQFLIVFGVDFGTLSTTLAKKKTGSPPQPLLACEGRSGHRVLWRSVASLSAGRLASLRRVA